MKHKPILYYNDSKWTEDRPPVPEWLIAIFLALAVFFAMIGVFS